MARQHRLSPLLAARRPDGFSANVAETFRRDRLTTLGRSTLFRQALGDLLLALDEEGLDVAVLKGIAYEDLIYPQPGTRPASDIDILVHPRQRREVLGTLVRLGYVPYASAPGFDEPDYHEVSLRLRDINLDLHFALAPRQRCHVDYEQLWAEMQVWSFGGRPSRTLGFTHAALNQALHMAIHHFDVPAIYILDFRRLLDAAGPGGLARVRVIAEEWKCARALRTTLSLARSLLGPRELPSMTFGTGGDEAGGLGHSGWMVQRVVDAFGGLSPISRPEQLLRKVAHFDNLNIAVAYLSVQGRRIIRERWLKFRGDARSATDRLGLG